MDVPDEIIEAGTVYLSPFVHPKFELRFDNGKGRFWDLQEDLIEIEKENPGYINSLPSGQVSQALQQIYNTQLLDFELYQTIRKNHLKDMRDAMNRILSLIYDN